MRNKKLYALFSFLLIVGLLLSGCGQAATPTTTTQTTPPPSSTIAPAQAPAPTPDPNKVIADAVSAYFTNMPSDVYKIPLQTLKDDLDKNPGNYIVFDVRQPDAYAKGHIKGAINIPYGPEIAKNLEKMRNAAQGKTAVVACYTGQTAGQTDSLLNLAGIKARSLDFGMGMDNFEKGWMAMKFPVVTEPATLPDAAAVPSPNKAIDDAVKKYFDPMPKDSYKIPEATLKDELAKNKEKYFIVDIRKADVFTQGHVPGAINVPFGPDIAKNLQMLKDKAQGKTLIVYCYTGQTAGQTDSLLNLTGINAKSLNFGFGTTGFSKGWSTLGKDYPIEK